MKLRIYRMYFETPLRLKPDVEGNFPRSDTIFAAVANVIVELEGVEALKDFCESDPRFSSAFPFYENKLFFPKPIRPPREIENDRELLRIWKKKSWIEEELLKDQEATLDVIKREIEEKKSYGDFIAKDNIPKFYDEIEIVRNAKHRINEQTQIFAIHALKFKKSSGLYFLYSGDVNIDYFVKILGEEGLGGGRSIGYGKFRVKPESYSWKISGKWDLLLSLCLPERSEVEILKNAYYSLLEKGGWTDSSRKRRVRVLVEGSVLPKGMEGRILEDQVDDVKIYRNYLALTLPMGWWN